MSDTVASLYERTALAWLKARRAELVEKAWLDRFTTGLRPGATILDVGCGGGEPIAAELLRRDFSVTGLDASPSLIEHAKARLPAGEWLVGDMRGLDLGRRFDAILAWHSFFHLSADDQRAMFPRFADHTANGARLMFTCGPEAGVAWGEWEGEPLFHASLDPEEYRSLLGLSGFTVEIYLPVDATCGGATLWLARRNHSHSIVPGGFEVMS